MMARGNFPSAKQDQFNLRMPDGMRDQVKASAEANGRSMNAEIVYLIGHALDYFEHVNSVSSVSPAETRYADRIDPATDAFLAHSVLPQSAVVSLFQHMLTTYETSYGLEMSDDFEQFVAAHRASEERLLRSLAKRLGFEVTKTDHS